jgi:hypothetical protein
MKNIALILFISGLLLSSCNNSGNKNLIKSIQSKDWHTTGNVQIKDSILILNGATKSILNKGNYKNFELSMELRTTSKGKGFIGIHTDPTDKGYRIIINNDREEQVWWRMTGSLFSIRNLTKSFVKDDEWFKMNIRVEGQLITVRINDELVVEYVEPSEPYRKGLNAKTLLSEGTFSVVSTGNGSIEFREMSVKDLDSKDINIEAQLAIAKNEQTDDIIRLHQEDFPVLDYHVHLKGGLTKSEAAKQSRRWGINYAVAPNCGLGFPITNDNDIYAYLDTMRSQPFILAMQAEGREWVNTFSPEARNEFDYVFSDALTFNDHKGRRVHLWVNKEVIIDDEQEYMDMIVDRTCSVLKEPFDIFVNPFFLPKALSDRYDEFWTEERMNKVIDMLAKSGKALEINELYQIPNKALIVKAKNAGVKFTFGSNNVTPEVSKLEYSIRMIKECGLTQTDMYKPKIKI